MQDITQFIQNHLALNLALVAVLFALMLLEFISQKRGTKQLSPAQTTQQINHANATILDIRSAPSYKEGHIIGAVSLPLPELDEKIKKLEKYKSNPIVVVCANGTESPRAASILTQKGFDVRILAGGTRAWIDAELPIVKE
jgi:rhodanese-related sulfurtransferase